MIPDQSVCCLMDGQISIRHASFWESAQVLSQIGRTKLLL